MSAATQNFSSSLTGNIPKAILYVRDVNRVKEGAISASKDAAELSRALLSAASDSLKGATQTWNSLKSMGSAGQSGTAAGGTKGLTEYAGFVGIEVQYNPNSIYLDSQSDRQIQYSGGGLGQASNNQITQITQPVSTTMSFQLVFDDVNPSDAFMINSFSLTGDAASKVANLAKKSGEGYSVRKQMDGLMSLLVSDATRQVVFFWAQMCFHGEVTNVNSRYTMFNPSGNPIRGVVDLTIRQGSLADNDGYDYSLEEAYWDLAFDEVFNEEGIAGQTSTFQKVTQNNFLNLNI